MDAKTVVSLGIQRMFGDLCGGLVSSSAANASNSSGGNETLFYGNNLGADFNKFEFKKDSNSSKSYQKDIAQSPNSNITSAFQQLDEAITNYEGKLSVSNSSKKSFADSAKSFAIQEAESNLGFTEIKKATQHLKQLDSVLNTHKNKIYQGKKDLADYEMGKVLLEAKTKSTHEKAKNIDEEIKKYSEKGKKADMLGQKVDTAKPKYMLALSTRSKAQDGIESSSSKIESINSQIQSLLAQQSAASSSNSSGTTGANNTGNAQATNNSSGNTVDPNAIASKINTLESLREIEESKIEKNQKDIEDSEKVISEFEDIQQEYEGALDSKNAVKDLLAEKEQLYKDLSEYKNKIQNYESRKDQIKAELEKNTVAVERLNIDRELAQSKLEVVNDLYKESFKKTEKQKVSLEKREDVARNDQNDIKDAESYLNSKLGLFNNIKEQSKNKKPNLNT